MSNTHLIKQLNQDLQALTLDFPPELPTRLLNYLNLLIKWNKVYNLTAIHTIAEMIPKHLLDSLAIVPYLQGSRILDVGTGAGLPGLILAMARPEWHYVLLDSNAKKIRFVTQAVIELQIHNVEAVCTRIENFTPIEPFDTVIARAYSRLRDFYKQTAHLCKTKGCLLAMKGVQPADEIAEMQDLPVQITSIPLHIPQLQAQRHVIVIR